MSNRALRRPVGILLAAAAATLAMASGAAATEPVTPPPAPSTNCPEMPPSPFKGAKLVGLKEAQVVNWHGPECTIKMWALKLDDATAGRDYKEGGKFYLYSPEEGRIGGFLLGDIMYPTVNKPGLVSFIHIQPSGRTEVRYGDPESPEESEVVAYAEPGTPQGL